VSKTFTVEDVEFLLSYPKNRPGVHRFSASIPSHSKKGGLLRREKSALQSIPFYGILKMIKPQKPTAMQHDLREGGWEKI
jgi:hypothetical protein